VLVLVARSGAVLDLVGLQASLVQQLARYKQPRRVVVTAALPKTALGKVQKALLCASLLSAGGSAAD
jgi:malonyl-CoA/methylmalonyl-CoA synthetase